MIASPHTCVSYFARKRKALVLCWLVGLLACSHPTDKKFEEVANDLRERMLPQGAFATENTTVVHTSISASTEWDIHSNLGQLALRKWLDSRLSPDFRKINETSDLVIFGKYDGNDSIQIEVRFLSGEQAHVRLTMTPD